MKQYLLLICLFFGYHNGAHSQISGGPITKDMLLGKLNYSHENGFIEIAPPYSSRNIYLNKETYKAFIKMYEAAKKDGITLQIISGARNFDYQKGIWERKWKSYEEYEASQRTKLILKYSSMPATSRHHWGTDIDLNNLENAYFESGKGKAEYEWLVRNAPGFGFHQVYTSKSKGRTGYEEEKWHWSYLPVANKYLKAYNEEITYEDITGFNGSALARENQMISAYVNGISKGNETSIASKIELQATGTEE